MNARFTTPSAVIAQEASAVYGGDVRERDGRFEVSLADGQEAG